PLWLRFVLLLAASTADVPFLAVRRALAPTTVPDERFPDAVTLTTVTAEVAILVGAGLGGVLVAVLSAPGALLFDAATFLVSGACVAAIRGGRQSGEHAAPVRTRLRRGAQALVADGYVVRLLWFFPVVCAGALGTEALIA